jgi:monovalent cation/hydrogen antiporter
MHSVEVLLGLLAALAVLATFAAVVGVPSPIVQVLGGAALGFWPGPPRIEVAPDIIFLLFLTGELGGRGRRQGTLTAANFFSLHAP